MNNNQIDFDILSLLNKTDASFNQYKTNVNTESSNQFHHQVKIPEQENIKSIVYQSFPTTVQSKTVNDTKSSSNTKLMKKANDTTFSDPSNSQSSARRKFTTEEDEQLKSLIAKYGAKKWDKIALFMPGRTGRQCRDRFANYLEPSLTNSTWTKSEDLLLEQKVLECGQHWNVIAKCFKGRSANNIKNRWYTYLSGQKKNRKNSSNNCSNCNSNDYSCVMQSNNINNNNNCEFFYQNLPVNVIKCTAFENEQLENGYGYGNNKIWFPMIYPTDNYFIATLNTGMLELVNQQYVI